MSRRSSTWWLSERVERRRALVYSTHTGTRDITERVDDIITGTVSAWR